MSLPCIGWFDDCDNVLKILEKFRNARINESNIDFKRQSKAEESILVANLVKVGEVDYKKIRLIYKQKTEEVSFDPTKYNTYDQQFFLANGSVDRQRGFVYYDNGKELFKIIVDDEDDKIESLKEYLFGSGIKFEVKSNDKLIKEGCFVKIDSIPEMPEIKVKNTSASDVMFRLKIEYRRDIRSDEDYFPESEWKTVKANDTWTIDFGEKIRGGKATLLYKTVSKEYSFIFHIRGSNPTEQEVKNYISEQGYDIWFLTRLIRQESGYHQFNVGTKYGADWNDYVGCPNFNNNLHGWGLMQLDNLNAQLGNHQAAGGWRPSAQALWDWKENIRIGVAFLQGEKYNMVNNHFDRELDIVEEWNLVHQDDLVNGHADQAEGNITYTHSNSYNFNHDLGDDPTGNNHSFIDATWIKNYNGSSRPESNDGWYYNLERDSKQSKPYWEIYNLNVHNHNYVEAVSNRAE